MTRRMSGAPSTRARKPPHELDNEARVVDIPVSDFDRAKEFYERLGWRLTRHHPVWSSSTPHGSWCSFNSGSNLSAGETQRPSAKEYLIVSDIAVRPVTRCSPP